MPRKGSSLTVSVRIVAKFVTDLHTDMIMALCFTLTACSFTSQALGCVGNCYI